MRISDWSSDVCSSDLAVPPVRGLGQAFGQRLADYSTGKLLSNSSVPGRRRPLWLTAICPAFAPEAGAEASDNRSEEHTSELQSLMRISYAVFCLKKKKKKHSIHDSEQPNTLSLHKYHQV